MMAPQSFLLASLGALAAAILCIVHASPLPGDSAQPQDDASASAPSFTDIINCANGVGNGDGVNNCSMTQVPGGTPSLPDGYPSVPSGLPSIPRGPGTMSGDGENNGTRPSVSQGIDCATAVGNGNGLNNCTTIFAPPGSGIFGNRKQ